MERLLSPRDVAAAIGASESSLKRWADEGLLRFSRTAGGHRRIALREALRYIRATGTPLVRPEALGLAGVLSEGDPGTAERDSDAFLVERMVAGDGAVSRNVLLSRYLGGESVAALCDGPMREAMRQVGELWHHGVDGIHVEHRAVDACLHSLNYLRAFLPDPLPEASLALGGAPAGDPYLVPSLMAATVLAAEGWREMNLGANVPGAAMAAAARQFRPRLIWISFSSREAVDPALRELGEVLDVAREIGASVVAGGQCVSQKNPQIQILSSMEALAAFSRGMTASQAVGSDV